MTMIPAPNAAEKAANPTSTRGIGGARCYIDIRVMESLHSV